MGASPLPNPTWREALGPEPSASQCWAEYRMVKAATGQGLADWLRAVAIERRAGEDRQRWMQLNPSDWQAMADHLVDEIALSLQTPDWLKW